MTSLPPLGPSADDPRPLGTFLLRAAALPFETIERPTGAPAPAPGAYAAPLPTLLSTPSFQEALRLASPDLFATAARPRPAGAGGDKLERALWRYALRMSGRATPFGLFASISTGQIGATTQLQLAPARDARRRIQPDAVLLSNLIHRLLQEPAVRAAVRYRLTPQTTHLGSKVRTIPFSLASGEPPGLIDITAKPVLLRFLDIAREGGTLDELAAALEASWPRSTAAKRRTYVEQLADLGVLTPDLLPSTTGPRALGQLHQSTAAIPPLAGEHRALASVLSSLDALGELPPGEGLHHYDEAARAFAEPPLLAHASHLFHGDLWRPTGALTLGPALVGELLAVARFLAALPASISPRLRRFRDGFLERYDGRFVPLLQALDDDYGVGFSKASFQEDLPLLDGVPLAPPTPPGPLSALHRRLLEKLASAAPCRELVLQPEDLDLKPGSLPSSFGVMASLAATGAEAVDQGDFLLFNVTFQAPSMVYMMGRFCGLHPSIEELARSYIQAEELASDDIIADRIDLLSGRIANVLQRPVLCSREVVVQGRSGAPPEQQIHLDDLLVGVEGSRVVLYSRRLGRRVRLRATNALNPTNDATLPIQHFLGALEEQDGVGRSSLGWGDLRAPFLPRLRVGRAILAPARWRLDAPDLRLLRDARNLPQLRERLDLPRWVGLAEGDNVLPIDLDDPLGRELLSQECQGKSSVVLEEFLPALLPRPLRGPEGTFVHEMIVPFVSSPPAPRPPPPAPRPAPIPIIPPGQGVLYLRIYGAPAELERWLLGSLAPLLDPFPWFFVRYHDTSGHHLRIRVFGSPESLWGSLQGQIFSRTHEAIAQKLLERVQIDSYAPETERYGGPSGLPIAEQIFCADSRAAVALIPAALAPPDRWRAALLAIDAMLADAELSLPERMTLCEQSAAMLSAELGERDKVQKALGEQARRQRQAMEECFRSPEPPWSTVREHLDRRSEAMRPLFQQLYRLEREGELSVPVRDRLWDFAHMTCNRLFTKAQRTQETVLWSLLERHYRTQQARQGGK